VFIRGLLRIYAPLPKMMIEFTIVNILLKNKMGLFIGKMNASADIGYIENLHPQD
jgi:hypothetical protein